MLGLEQQDGDRLAGQRGSMVTEGPGSRVVPFVKGRRYNKCWSPGVKPGLKQAEQLRQRGDGEQCPRRANLDKPTRSAQV